MVGSCDTTDIVERQQGAADLESSASGILLDLVCVPPCWPMHLVLI